MTVRKKLMLGLVFLIFVLLSLGVGIFWSLQGTSQDIDVLVGQHVSLRTTAIRINYQATQHRRYEKDLFLNIGDPKKQEQYLQKFEQAAKDLRGGIEDLDRQLRASAAPPDALALPQRILSAHEAYLAAFRDVARGAMTGEMTPQAANSKFSAAKDHIYALEDNVAKVVVLADEGLDRHVESMRRSHDEYVIALSVLTLCSIVLTLFGAGWLYRSINQPLAALVGFAETVAGGDLEHKSEFSFSGEVARLHDAVDHMVDAIRERVAYNRAIINRVPDPIIVTGPRRNIRALNSAACALLGHAEDSLIGKPLGSYQGADVYGTEPPIDRLARTGEAETQLDFTRQMGGETRYFHSRAATVRKPDGTLVGYMEIRQDITTVKHGELEARERSERIAGVARDADAIATTVADAASQLSDRVGEAARGADRQLQRSSESATAMDEMAATVREVARNASDTNRTTAEMSERARQGADIVEKVTAAIEGLGSHSRELRSEMEKLGTQASDIGNVLGVISDIADQTNLLALNAAIEAARAGDAGRGFAVVADEVRKLAEKTMNATREVEAAIGGIQQSARRSAEATDVAVRGVTDSQALANEAGGMLQEIVHAVQQASDQVNSIATAAEQQAATGDELNRIIAEVNEISGSTAMRMSEAETAIAELSAQAAALRRLMDSMK
ncbi:PAS domain-containing protein [Desulfovibrio oxamicus]|uniref:PAS domain-containing protein n=1 Tax=Nitratidesulfovibrio oxamicus TaxID=32016 RepID=A0ABS0J9F2_9BACT|nr:methyl-accepting chemotaxis protein [Nitratidesulfovibrio oxamicus]MBG3879086.1 PAS domain-containing protein [Nitratidesulfovibrio oxamicus]